MLSRIASVSTSPLAVVLGLFAATACSAPGPTMTPVGPFLLVSAGGAGDGVFQFDSGGVTLRDEGESDDEIDLAGGPSPMSLLGKPIASCSSETMSAAVYPKYVVRLDKDKCKAFCNRLGLASARAIGMTDERMAVVAGKKVRIFEAETFAFQLDIDAGPWLKASTTAQLRFALPMEEEESVMLVGYGPKRKRTVVQVVDLVPNAGGKGGLETKPKYSEVIGRMILQSVAHDGGTVYVAGKQGRKLLARSYTSSPEWDHSEVVNVDWPERPNSEGELVAIGRIERMVAGHGLIAMLHKGGSLHCFRNGEEVLTKEGVQAVAIVSGSKLDAVQRDHLVSFTFD
jgi:hypothetical protein